MKVNLDEVLAATKTELQGIVDKAGANLDAAIMKRVGEMYVPVDGEHKTLGDIKTTLETRIKSLENALEQRGKQLGVGLKYDIDENGAINLCEAIPGLPSYDRNSRSRSIVNEYNTRKRGSSAMAEAERQASSQKRDMGHQDDEKGGLLIPMQLLGDKFIDLKRARVAVFDPAVSTVLDGLVGEPVIIPKELTAATIYWVGANEAPTSTDLTTGQIELRPKKAAAVVKMDNQFFRRASIAKVDTLVRNSISKGIALAVDLAALRGSGASNTPLGVANRSGIHTVAIGTNGGTFTYSVARDMIGDLESTDTLDGNLLYVSHPSVLKGMQKERIPQFSGDTAGAYVTLPMSDEQMKARLGYDFRKTTQLPTTLTKGSGTNLSEVYFANWEDLFIGLWSDIMFKASDVTGDSSGSALTTDKTWLFAFVEVDVQIGRAESFCLVNDAYTV